MLVASEVGPALNIAVACPELAWLVFGLALNMMMYGFVIIFNNKLWP